MGVGSEANTHENISLYNFTVFCCIWEKRNNKIKDPEPLKFCRRFERFAASLVRCLSEASCARKTSESATVQNGEQNFWSGSFILLFRFSHIHQKTKLFIIILFSFLHLHSTNFQRKSK